MLHPGLYLRVPSPFYRQYWHAVPLPWQVRRFLRSVLPHAVHIATEGPIGIVVRQACLQYGWDFTTSFHTRWDEHGKYLAGIPPALGWKWVRWFHACSARVLVPTASISALLRVHGFTQPLVQWPKGIDRQRFHLRFYQHAGVKRPIMLYVGRISREKNLLAYLDLAIEGTKYVVGDGPLLGKLKRLYHREVAAERVVFFGERKGRALAELYAEADVFVFPSKTDTFGNVILEALASGLPVAAYPGPGPIDILVGKHVVPCMTISHLPCIRRLHRDRLTPAWPSLGVTVGRPRPSGSSKLLCLWMPDPNTSSPIYLIPFITSDRDGL